MNTGPTDGVTLPPVCKACVAGDVATVRRLIEKEGVSPDFKQPNSNFTLLMFAAHEGHAELVKYLLSLKDAQSGACPPALRAAAIQTCAYLLSQPRFAKMEDLVNGTFQFVFDTAAEPNLILQVRNSQATKELCTYLLSSPELYKPQIDRVIQLLRVILVYANSSPSACSTSWRGLRQ